MDKVSFSNTVSGSAALISAFQRSNEKLIEKKHAVKTSHEVLHGKITISYDIEFES